MLTKHELKHILDDAENYRIEWNVSIDNVDKFFRAIGAFSNDFSGREKNDYLVLGVQDNGRLSGLKADELLHQTDFLPVHRCGRVWARVVPRKSMEPEDKTLTEKRLSDVYSFDAMPCLRTTIADLDVSLIKREFLPKAIAKEVLAEDKRSIEEQLASLGFYDLRHNCPTNGAIVLFGVNPERYLHGSYVQYVRFKGKDRTGNIVNEHKFSGNLCKELAKIDTFIETSISQKHPVSVSVLREESVSKYPYRAIRELLMNAIMHRDYETNAPIQFYEYDDRIEVQNPGGLYGKVTPANFPNVNDYRNPFIAEAMMILGYVNRFSRGVYRMQKELSENGNGEVAFDFSSITTFKATGKVSEKYSGHDFASDYHPINSRNTSNKMPENHLEEHSRIGYRSTQDRFNGHSLNIRKELYNTFDNYLINNGQMIDERLPNAQEIFEGYGENTQLKTQLNSRSAPGKYPTDAHDTPNNYVADIPWDTRKAFNTQFNSAQQLPLWHQTDMRQVFEKRPINIRQKGESPQNQIILAIRSKPAITRNELAVLLNRTQDSIKHHLLQLVRRGVIRHEGSTKAGKWVIL